MSGIVAYTGNKNCVDVLTDGLRRLAYRGYDSAGIALIQRNKLKSRKTAGTLDALTGMIGDSLTGQCGVGHTRWATHGAVTDVNAHPHLDAAQRLAIVHNGIIENIEPLRQDLLDKGIAIRSDTDSEVLAHMLAESEGSLVERVRAVLARVNGTYGLATIDIGTASTVVVARNGSPMILGIGEGEMLAASDQAALLRYTRQVVHLEDGEVAELTPEGFRVTALDASPSLKVAIHTDLRLSDYDKGEYDYFLHREIHDQPQVIRRTLSGRLDRRFSTAHLGGLNMDPRELLDVSRVKILGCGTAYYAGLAGAHMIEQLARIPTDAEPAAEFRYRNPIIERNCLYIAVSQSGETFDTLAAVREVRRRGGIVLGIVNSVGSTIAREVDGGIYTHAGPELSVASSKSYTSSLTVFALLAVMLGRLRDISPQHGSALVASLDNLPAMIEAALELESDIKQLAALLHQHKHVFFLGRTTAYPVALEAAQILKEISYVHAEALASSELKHGALALIGPGTPCVVVLPDNDLLPKAMDTLKELKSRDALLVVVTDSGRSDIAALADHVLQTPVVDEIIRPIVMAVPLQLLAYHVARELQRDVDQPRNLNKCITVE
ncbi:MAG: glutamine--fructose-6-phosphate transaminase (isomerizing) [Granulosicoccus sp.]